MIKLTFYQNAKQQITGFTCSGHAGYAESGSDIVCAAVSALVINTINTIDSLTDDDFRLDTKESAGLIVLKMEGKISSESQLLLQSLLLGIQNMEEDEAYQSYIDLIIEEV